LVGGGSSAFNVCNSTNIVSCISGTGGTGSNNFFTGFCAGICNTTSGVNNVFIGLYSGASNTAGNNNFFAGSNAGRANTCGNNNTFIGNSAGACNTAGNYNFYVGRCAGLTNTTGNYNFFAGFCAGACNTTGSNNVFIGCFAGCATTTGCNQIVLGGGASASSATANNEITLGNSSIATIRAQVTSITSLSDARDKCDIQTLNSGMDFLSQIRPVTFAWNMRDGGKIGVKETGFIAQELEQALTSSPIRDWLSDLVISDPERNRLEAAPGKLLPLMVRALQEHQQEIDQLRAEIARLKHNDSQ
jgi:hypothetical protein